jgi:hypothetical protein
MKPASIKPVRCAIYTRVSTEHGLDQEFNSLDAQYDAASAPETERRDGNRRKPPQKRPVLGRHGSSAAAASPHFCLADLLLRLSRGSCTRRRRH